MSRLYVILACAEKFRKYFFKLLIRHTDSMKIGRKTDTSDLRNEQHVFQFHICFNHLKEPFSTDSTVALCLTAFI